MINDNADEVIEELFQSALSRYQIGLETSMRDSNFYLIVFIYYIINAIKQILNEVIICIFSWLDKKQKTNNKSREKER